MGELVKFPVTNPRMDLSSIKVDQAALEKELEKIRVGYFTTVADQITEDILRSIAIMRLEEGKSQTHPVESKDIILIKETIISTMCRIVGIEHPLHQVGEDEIVLTEYIEDVEGFDVPYFKYKFRSEPDENTRSEV